MYRIWHYLFGWDYIIWSNNVDSGIAKVIRFKDGSLGYWRYKITNVFDPIKHPEQVKWLTCKPTKYFMTKEEEEIEQYIRDILNENS